MKVCHSHSHQSTDMENYVVHWLFDTSSWMPTSKEWQHFLTILPAQDSAKVESFRFTKDRKMALASCLMQRRLIQLMRHRINAIGITTDSLTGLDMIEFEIARTAQNKPFYVLDEANRFGLRNWNYNVSHHEGVVVIASHPVCMIGIDVMDRMEKPRGQITMEEFFNRFKNYFTTYEWKCIRGQHDKVDEQQQYQEFCRFWTMKEAYIKAIGIGLGFALNRAEFHVKSDGEFADLFIDGILQEKWKVRVCFFDRWVIAEARGPVDEAYDHLAGTFHEAICSPRKHKSSLRLPFEPWEQIKLMDIASELVI